ncbi:uncharacterized protein LOC118761470 [Octopus sinensis]|uniref:Uncharacterized protein LOC118761470 n=1 Tax=Octopus sinensis TaxID=2607531 RepID=A0A7E6EIV7_9MOLL|nr:uncharacterized protein LOC118761470 [Octopus sinensis]
MSIDSPDQLDSTQQVLKLTYNQLRTICKRHGFNGRRKKQELQHDLISKFGLTPIKRRETESVHRVNEQELINTIEAELTCHICYSLLKQVVLAFTPECGTQLLTFILSALSGKVDSHCQCLQSTWIMSHLSFPNHVLLSLTRGGQFHRAGRELDWRGVQG